MSHRRIGASMLGALGIFVVFVLFGISCGTSTNSTVSKSAVNTEPCTIVGLVWDDTDNDGEFDPGESGVPDIEVMFYEFGQEQIQYKDETDAVGVYQIVIDGPRDDDMDGSIGPTEFGVDYDSYYPAQRVPYTVYEVNEFQYGPTFYGFES
jgi:hypothetical protein